MLHSGITKRKKGRGIKQYEPLPLITIKEKIEIKTFGFLYFYLVFVLSSFFRSTYLYTPIAQKRRFLL